MSETEEKRLFKLTESEIAAIRAAMAECDGTWELKVRPAIDPAEEEESDQSANAAPASSKYAAAMGASSFTRNRAAGPPPEDRWTRSPLPVETLLTQDDDPPPEGLVGVEVGLFITPFTTQLGDLEAVAKICEFTFLDAAGRGGIMGASKRKPSLLADLSPIRNLTQLTILKLPWSKALTDITPLTALTALEQLALGGPLWPSPTDPQGENHLAPLQGLTQLKHLWLQGCQSIDVSPLTGLNQLEVLKLTTCGKVAGIEGLAALSALRDLDLGWTKEIHDCEALEPLGQLNSLRLVSTDVTDLSGLRGLTQLTHLSLMQCQSLTHFNGLEPLEQLESLEARSCRVLTDISAIRDLPLQKLNLSGATVLVDISALEGLSQLTWLNLSRCRAVADISPLKGLTQLKTLNGGSDALTDISPLRELKQLTNLALWGANNLSDISPLETLTQLTSLNLGSQTLSDISPLQGLERLATLSLSRCEAVADISPLRSLTNLVSLDLADCPELADNSKWGPLESLTALSELKGSFPSHLVTRLTARNAADAGDWAYAQSHLAQWEQVADQNADQPGLLTAIGRAAALDPAGYAALANLLTLAATHDAPEVDGLFAVACPNAEDDTIRAALDAAVEQADRPLPPETLVALHQHLPGATTLRDQTLLALARVAGQDDAPAWSGRTAQALREHVQGARYPVTTTVRDAVAQALQGQPFGAMEIGLFGALCSDHAQADDAWRDPFHQTLAGLALAQRDAIARNQALSDLAEGLALAGTWGEARLDALLEAAAAVDPDTSALQAAVARAHATAGRWDAAERAVYAVARPAQRDDCLKALATDVLNTDLTDRAQRAVALETGLSDPFERTERLVALGANPVLLADAVAYGQLVALLAEQPEAQQQVITTAIAARSELSEAQVPDAEVAVTGREQRLIEARDDAWSEAVRAEAPDTADAVEARVKDGGRS